MNKILRAILVLPALLFTVTGLRFATDPASAAQGLGMPLLDGIGRSSQIGDVGALFLGMGLMILLALVTGRRSWFQAPALLLALIAAYRLLAWAFHGAGLDPAMVVVEVVVSSLLLLASALSAEKVENDHQ